MTQSAQKQVLIVDDEIFNRQLLVRLLRSNYETHEAEDAAEALAILEKSAEHISLMLCDHLMPGMRGAELAGVVHERWPKIPIMLLTGYDQDEDVKQVLEQKKIHAIVAKPWQREKLEELMDEIFQGSSD